MIMKKHVLSKSTFMRGVQCLKSLYLNRFHPELRNELTDQQQAVFDTGHKVGKLAQELFPGGIEVDIKSLRTVQEAVTYTSKLIEEEKEVIYEAGFQFDEVLVLTDILVKGDGWWRIYEVKSSTNMKPQYILDTAVQYYVMSNMGFTVEDIFLIHINNQYTRFGEININAIFTLESVLEPVLEIQKYVENTIPDLKRVLELNEIPEVDIGEYCHDPVDCDFTEYCWKHVPSNSIFDISRLKNSDKFQFYNDGILTIDQVPGDFPLNDNQRLQVDCYKSKSNHIDRVAIRDFLQDIDYPLYFLDFETYAPAIPLYDNSRPYQQIPFQYSLHIKESEQAELKHCMFLGMPQEDPRGELIEQLLKEIGDAGSILVYNRGFEVRILKELMRDFPDYEDQISSIIERIRDLMIPFQKRFYYTPRMKGSYSIKAVLPALVSDLDYSDLAIAEGGAAMNAFEQLLDETDENKVSEIRQHLEEYCSRDTLAMVRILDVLRSQ